MKYEYKWLISRWQPAVHEILQGIGEDGWELISVVFNPVRDEYVYHFMRPILALKAKKK